jgi:hypothetical protein
LPANERGVIVNPEQFTVELFFTQADVLLKSETDFSLRPPSTGPSIIQTVSFSGSKSGGASSGIRFGATLDTIASVGATAIFAKTVLDDRDGGRIIEAAAQHVWGNRIARGGLFEDFNTQLLTSYRVAGVEFASFYPQSAYETGLATPIQVVLPRDADVEIRRQGQLVSIRHYGAGTQLIDTSGLPEGSYPIEIIARNNGVIILEDVRSFTKAPGMPIPGKTEFSIRAGFYTPDIFEFDRRTDTEPFFPRVGSDPVIAARVRRRIGGTTAIDLNAMHIAGEYYGEASLSTIRGRLRGFVTLAGSDRGSYGALASGALDIDPIRVTLTGRYTKSSLEGFDLANFDKRTDYRPFARSEKSVFGSVQFPLSGGSLSVSAGYTKFDRIQDDYSLDLRYTRPVRIAGRRPLLSAYARSSNREKRIGFTLNFLFGVDRQTSVSARAGGEYLTDVRGTAREGASPVFDVTLSHLREFGNLQALAQAGMSTQADSDRAYASVDLRSSWGQIDITGQYQRQRGGGNFSSIFANGRTGFAIGGGGAKIGLADVGQAAILSDIQIEEDVVDGTQDLKNSGYRIKVNGQPYDRIRPGNTSAVGVAAYGNYEVEMTAENAPPYEIDTQIRTVTLYPGNVAYFRYEAKNSYPIFGRLIDKDGVPISSAMLRSDSDVVFSDDRGYFLLSTSAEASITVALEDGGDCVPFNFAKIFAGKKREKLFRAGDLVCEVQ